MVIKEKFSIILEQSMIAYDEERRRVGSHLKLHDNRYYHHNAHGGCFTKLNIKRKVYEHKT